MSVCCVLPWIASARQEARSAGNRLDLRRSWPVLRRFGHGLVAYPVTLGLAFVGAAPALAVHATLALCYSALYYSFDRLRTCRATSGPGPRCRECDAGRKVRR